MDRHGKRATSNTPSFVRTPLAECNTVVPRHATPTANKKATATTAATTAMSPSTAALQRYSCPRENEIKVMHFIRQLPRFKFHFYGISAQRAQRMVQYLRANLAVVDSFFSNEITHLIVKDDVYERAEAQYKQHGRVAIDVTVNHAYAHRMHVWSLSKLNKIFDSVSRHVNPHIRSGQLLNGDLASQLRNETIYGPSSQQNDIYYFADNECYLLVEDLTGHHRPPLVEKYPLRSGSENPPWPRLWLAKSRRSPFIKPRNTTTIAAAATADQTAAPEATMRAATPAAAAAATLPRRQEQSQSRAITVRAVQANETPCRPNAPTAVLPDTSVQEISMASGLHPSVTTATLSTPSLATTANLASHTPNPSGMVMEQLNRRALVRLEENGVQYVNAGRGEDDDHTSGGGRGAGERAVTSTCDTGDGQANTRAASRYGARPRPGVHVVDATTRRLLRDVQDQIREYGQS
ncbi:hypothetical protein SYNPS1DRAFT_28008 [Syncephalis pseudoplumigaleata]|uniref:Regulatory subunit Dfp1/Him1 central region domain-containing protein n=1 Tax=Syncephalis pseudoplumigaleata TaxID=1712513 RepID=A0A4P9Z1S9_9FUNG|nr:hypothetical protein SYNPS1DRAFT_28008 [Syncephalis pseudoplumigaleata]|eukprot:RKP26298.1 hypothetical protein SYNPS1DRAFT_28008 [Syncephalis pseudoplumigaleata]